MIAESLRNSARCKAALPGLLLFGKEEKTFPELVEGNSLKTNVFDFYRFRVEPGMTPVFK